LKSLTFLSAFLLLFLAVAYPQNNHPGKGTVQRITIHGKALEGNLEGNSADRLVSVYLPPSYKTQPTRRYPVVYFLHGFTDDDAKYFGLSKHWMVLPPVLDSVFGYGAARDMIIVMPNASTRFKGSWYSNSITTGNWEDFIAKELVPHIDSRYRTIAKASSRGLTGHSMGGYGALRIGEKYPEVFSSIYLISPAALMQNSSPSPQSYGNIENVKTIEDFEKADFGKKAEFAKAAAWSPNLHNPPFYIDLPVKNGQIQTDVLNKWIANMPITTIDQYIYNLKKLRAIAFDAGAQDESIAAGIKVLDEVLNKYGVKHAFEIYRGNHTNRVSERIRLKMLPFFSNNLVFGK
jgi:S-formylglutathione hydrolase FrmB